MKSSSRPHNGPSTTGNPSGKGRGNNSPNRVSASGGNISFVEEEFYMTSKFPLGTQVEVKSGMWNDTTYKTGPEIRYQPDPDRSMGGCHGIIGKFPFKSWKDAAGLTGNIVGHPPSYPYARWTSTTCYVKLSTGDVVEFRDDEIEIIK